MADSAEILWDAGREGRTRRGRLRHRQRRSVCLDCAAVLAPTLDPDDTLRGIALSAAKLMGAPLAAIWTADETDRVVHRRGCSDERISAGLPTKAQSFWQGAAGWVAARRRPLSIRDVAADKRVLNPGWFRRHGLSSYVGFPILSDGSLLGVLSFIGSKPFRVDPKTRERLRAFLAQSAIVIRNARILAESEERRRTAEALAEASRALSQGLGPHLVAERVMKRARELLQVQAAALYRLEPQAGALTLWAKDADAESSFEWALFLERGQGVSAAAVDQRRTIATPDCLAGSQVRYGPETRTWLENVPYRAILAVPLIVQRRVFGSLTVGDRTGRVFTDQEIRLGQTFAEQAALALENARLYSEAERRRREAEVMTALARTISASLDLETVFERLSQAARELCGSDAARIALRDPESGVMRYRYWTPSPRGEEGQEDRSVLIEPGKGMSGLVLATGRPLRTDDLGADSRFTGDYLHIARRAGVGAVLVVPMLIDEHIEGLLCVHNRSRRPFTDQDEAILVALADQGATAIRNAQLYRAASEHRRVLQALTDQLSTAQEEERTRLAREIHDEVGQVLSAVKISLSLLHGDVGGGNETARARIAAATQAIQETLWELRRISANLRPVTLDILGLEPALRWHIERFTTLTGIAVELVVEGPPVRLNPEVGTVLYRVTQEALTNVARHAAVDRAWCRIRYREASVELMITDDGRGFSVDASSAWKEGRLGLVGIRERVRRLGGTLTLSSEPGGGTRLIIVVPQAAGDPREVHT